MMKISILFLALILFGCGSQDSSLREDRMTDKKTDVQKIVDNLRETAITDFDFFELEENAEEFEGQTFEIRGYIVDTSSSSFLMYADPYFDDNYGFFNIFIDNPLPKQTAPGKPLRHLTIGDKITLVAELNGTKTYELEKKTIRIPIHTYELSVSGEEFKNIPNFFALAIFEDESNNPKNPDWVSRKISLQFGLEEY